MITAALSFLLAQALFNAPPGALASDVAACRGAIEPGVIVNVQDESGAPIVDAKVTLREGKYKEVLSLSTFEFERVQDGIKPQAGRSYRGAIERQGVYELRVQRDKYATETRKVTVVKNGCNVKTVALTVTLRTKAKAARNQKPL